MGVGGSVRAHFNVKNLPRYLTQDGLKKGKTG